MNKNILVLCGHPQIGETLIRIIQQKNLGIPRLLTNARNAIKHIHNNPCDVILIGSGINDEITICNQIQIEFPHIKIIWHYGGGSGLILAELYQVINQ